jgi:peptidoglycan-associated lipoprotein
MHRPAKIFIDTSAAIAHNFNYPNLLQGGRMLRFARKLYIFSILTLAVTACGTPKNPPPPQWTVENPSASSGASQRSAQAAPRANIGDKEGASSLDALRSGQSTASSGPLKDVPFAFDRAELSESARTTLKANAEWLKKNAAARVQIEGHCDERGAEDYNMALGAKRAQAAMDYLNTLGIAGGRLSTVSYGEEVPACRESTEPCWAKNRRARFVIVSGGPSS